MQKNFDVMSMYFVWRNVDYLVNLEKNACGKKCRCHYLSKQENYSKKNNEVSSIPYENTDRCVLKQRESFVDFFREGIFKGCFMMLQQLHP